MADITGDKMAALMAESLAMEGMSYIEDSETLQVTNTPSSYSASQKICCLHNFPIFGIKHIII